MTRQDDVSERRDQSAASSKRQRIAKLMARAGLCSRRDAEAWIVEGRVSVNGEVLTSPAIDVEPEDLVLVDNEPLPVAEKTRLFLFHKPRGLVTSDHDPEGRRTVADFLRETWPDGPRVVTIGRLDINTEGLLLLTNDGGLARMLELPQTGWVRRYRVRAKGSADVGALEALAAGVTIDGIDYAGIDAKLDRVQGANCWLTMGLREGKNREVKRVLEHVGLEVNRLIRVSFGPFQLLELPEGAVEEVRTRVLRDQLGPTLAAQAGVDFGDAEPTERPKIPSDRPPSRPPRQRADVPRDDRRRPVRREELDEPAPVRERPQGGTRKHVGTLRAARTDEAKAGPRKRIERSDTRDRRDRTVAVERLVSTRAPERPVRRRRPGDEIPVRNESGRRATGEARERKGRGENRAGPEPRRHASPAAEAKSVRRARSGGAPEREASAASRRDAPNTFRSDGRPKSGAPRGERPERRERRPEGAERKGPPRERPGRDARPASAPRSDRVRSDRPPREDAARARPRPDAPRAERPRSDRPKFDQPKFDRPKFGKSDADTGGRRFGKSVHGASGRQDKDDRPRQGRGATGGRPDARKADDRPKSARFGGPRSPAPASGKTGARGADRGKPDDRKFRGDKPAGGKPAGGRRVGDKPRAPRPGGKPSGNGRPGAGRSGDAKPRGPSRPKR